MVIRKREKPRVLPTEGGQYVMRDGKPARVTESTAPPIGKTAEALLAEQAAAEDAAAAAATSHAAAGAEEPTTPAAESAADAPSVSSGDETRSRKRGV